jgi:hypothetical protein
MRFVFKINEGSLGDYSISQIGILLGDSKHQGAGRGFSLQDEPFNRDRFLREYILSDRTKPWYVQIMIHSVFQKRGPAYSPAFINDGLVKRIFCVQICFVRGVIRPPAMYMEKYVAAMPADWCYTLLTVHRRLSP